MRKEREGEKKQTEVKRGEKKKQSKGELKIERESYSERRELAG